MFHDGREWSHQQVGNRIESFSLSGWGTQRIPISRPQVAVAQGADGPVVHVIFRDRERGNRVTLATCADLKSKRWLLREISHESVGLWEPSYDRVLWRKENKLHIYLQKVEQADAEGLTDVDATPVSILEYIAAE